MLNHMNISHFSLCRKYLFPILLITAVVMPAVVTAGIYKWTDEAGNVHYGSQRPPDADAERLKIKTSSQPYVDENIAEEKKEDATKEDGETTAEPDKKPEAVPPKKDEKPKLSRKEKQKQCQVARQRLQTIESRGRVRVTEKDGTSRHLTEQERNKRLADVRKDVSKYCR